MQRFQNILVATNTDDTPQALLASAARLAGRSMAALTLLAVVDDLPWYSRLDLSSAGDWPARVIQDELEKLEPLAASLRLEGLSVSTKVVQGRPSIEIVREVLAGGHDLLMKQAEPGQGAAFGSTDMHLLRTCPCPLWLFKPDHAGRPFARILAAVDPCPAPDADLLHLRSEVRTKDETLDSKILTLATSLAEAEGAECHVVHAWSAPGERLVRGQRMVSQEQVERYVEDWRTCARDALERLLSSTHDHAGRVFAHLLKGDAADVITDFATSQSIDLIVMGTVARTGVSGLLIGNTAESILQRVDCSVLAVKPEGFVSPVGPRG